MLGKDLLKILKESKYTTVLSGFEMLQENGYPAIRDGEESYDIEQKYGYSVDEIYDEKLCKKKKIYFYNKSVAVHTYRTETNLSSTYKVKRSFVLEREEHRQSMSNQSWIFRFCNKYLHDGLFVSGIYGDEKILNEKKMFNIIKRIYIYSQVFSYKNMKIKNRKK